MVFRKAYMEKIIPLIDKKLIKVITGVRRCGKTVFLSQICDYLLKNGVEPKQIINISLESKKNAQYKNGNLLYNDIIDFGKKNDKKTYIFLDEIQMVENWQEVVSSLLIDIDCDIYITGSNSKLLSGELASLLSGRYIQIHIYPFTLSEAKEAQIENNKYIGDQELFQDYLKYGGLPMRFILDDTTLDAYLSDTYDGIVTKDIINRNNINNPTLLHNLLSFLMDNIANPYSCRSIVNTLKTNGISTNTNNIINYVDYITKACIMYPVNRYDIKGKKLLSTTEKYYAVDLGLRNVIKNSENIDYDKLYENIVFLELLYRGYTVKVGKLDNKEIDFIAYKGEEKEYYQVCYLLNNNETIEREFDNLRKINDNYPKYVISGDIPNFSQNGIKHYNIIDFLLKK